MLGSRLIALFWSHQTQSSVYLNTVTLKTRIQSSWLLQSIVRLTSAQGRVMAALVDAIGQHNPAAIGLDVYMPEADQTSPEQVAQALQTAQARLAEQLRALPGNDQLAAGSPEVIEQVRAVLTQWPVVPDVDVVGHTDAVGSAAQNDALSLQRAQAVARMLNSPALSADRLHASGRGERQLLVPTSDDTPEPQNRRVEITVY